MMLRSGEDGIMAGNGSRRDCTQTLVDLHL
jgi:hypothetical protein